MPGPTSASALLALLDEPEQDLQAHALTRLNDLVDIFWAEIADSVSKIEVLYEDERFGQRELAALVASKVYFHLGEYEESMAFALGAKEWFDLESGSEYVETIISKCIDTYIDLSVKRDDDPASIGTAKIDPRLQDVVERMFRRCLDSGEYKQGLGIALESRRLDAIEHFITATSTTEDLKAYVLSASMTLVQSVTFRNKVLKLLVDLYLKEGKGAEPDYFNVGKCVVYLNDNKIAFEVLRELVAKGDEKHLLTAYQIAFDFDASATQDFLQKVSAALPTDDEKNKEVYDRIRKILLGEESIPLFLEFLYRNNKTDIQILNKTKDTLEARNSIFHSAVTFANAFMHSGTTADGFFRSNLDWLAKATNWSKFSATAALGVIHKGHLSQAMTLLQPYLPQDGVSTSPYSEGGSLFALGLIHANHGAGVLDYLRTQFKATQDETIQHGAALGLGVAGMATGNEDIYEELKNVLFGDSAVAGEATGLAMGLVMLGTGHERALEEMLQYAHETQHEKIIRGLAVGMALLQYAREESADGLIAQLTGDASPILRYGGIWTIALAYAGTGNNKAIRQLLHFAVSDVNDDVRRVAVMALGFILFRNPGAVPRLVELLSESYNPHVRYGASLALGISCAGTGMPEAIKLLEPMIKDPTDFVRQGALISMAMILMQHNDQTNPKVTEVRAQFAKTIGERHEDAMAKFGAALAQGIIDAGGRNVTIGLQSPSGSLNLQGIVGMALFTQFWYWFPTAHFLSLAFTPTAVIGLNKDLKVPKFEFVSNAKPSTFAYPPEEKAKEEKKDEKMATVELSTTAKTKARARAKKEKEGDSMELDEQDVKVEEDKMETDETEKKDDKKEKKEKEPSSEAKENMTRVVPAQLKYVTFLESARYVPVKQDLTGGVVMMLNKKPEEPEELVEMKARTEAASAPADQAEEEEAPMPEAFEYPFPADD
ncbi:26S proteasome regulatory complex, non-ATPase subcomplex, Rpn2/Psmd1 subunit [Saitoella complicata NRRL Y-17804]|nr:26S proteasome regulatory complex, non-ATPase subcomplex, Rpn2/Psmd1 subunit [Saitoella complicata NRRL Y-17804]ODQ51271.1 26S proteasome regulatory complex, non-ATPase subcomplex, Rpn2/Psmd1 subunit [Saitoella complicata NRRL Y-17804]